MLNTMLNKVKSSKIGNGRDLKELKRFQQRVNVGEKKCSFFRMFL